MGLGILLGGLIGIPTLTIGGVDLSLSTSGGTLIMGLIFGYIHDKRPTVGCIPQSVIWFLSNVGLAVFIAVVGILLGRYVFKWNGACAGAMTATAAIGVICEKAKSNAPVMGYTITYAGGNILLTIWSSLVVLFFA